MNGIGFNAKLSKNLEKYINNFKNYEIPKTMKATVLSRIGFENVVIKEVPVPVPGPKQLLAFADAAGVCPFTG